MSDTVFTIVLIVASIVISVICGILNKRDKERCPVCERNYDDKLGCAYCKDTFEDF